MILAHRAEEDEIFFDHHLTKMTTDIEKQPHSQEGPKPPQPDVFDIVGGDGLWQRLIFLVVLFYAIPSATFNLSMSFLAPNLDHWCARPEGSNWTVKEWTSMALPDGDRHCSRYKEINVTFPLGENSTITRSDETISCDSWEYDTSFYHNTVLSQWDLVCDQEWLVSMSKSIFMAGIFFSNLVFGQMADSFGRRPAITVCACIAVSSAVICAFSTSFIMFIITRFFVALGIAGVYNISFVLLMEVVSPERRSLYGIAMNFGWCIGFVSLPGIAYVLRDWFWIQIALTAPCVVLFFNWWMLPESCRWLLSQGKMDEAHKVLTRAAKMNGKDVNEIDTKLRKIMSKATEVHESGSGKKATLLDLFRTPGLWQMTLNIYFLWFVNSFVYYGLSYNTNELAGDPFVNFAICGAVEFPAYFLTIFTISRFGRRNNLAAAMIIGGVACLLMYPLPEDPWWAGVTVSMIGKFCITSSFAIIFVFTAEIFPTVVRNIGLGSASVFARFGSLFAPFVRELGNATHPVVPQVVFGILAFVSGIMVFMLPETNNMPVPETLEEAALRCRRPTKKKNTTENGHVLIKLSNGDGTQNIEDDGMIFAPAPSKPIENGIIADVIRLPEPETPKESDKITESVKPQENGKIPESAKKLEDVPEEDSHHEAEEVDHTGNESASHPAATDDKVDGAVDVVVDIEDAKTAGECPTQDLGDEEKTCL